jgi:outer membrane lipoprotein SlyB
MHSFEGMLVPAIALSLHWPLCITRDVSFGQSLVKPQYHLEMPMTDKTLELDRNADANRDPISGAPGAHPVGTGLGAAAGGIGAGAAAGSVVGPAGTLIGAVVGAVAGGLAGKGVAELIDPTAEEAYWRENYSSRSYVKNGASFDDYGPAYRYGVESHGRVKGRTFEQAEPELMHDWERAKGTSGLTWNDARHATRDSWQRVSGSVERAVPGDSDRDGK